MEEEKVVETEQVQEAEKLDLADALEVGLAATKTDEELAREQQAPAAEATTDTSATPGEEVPALSPPAEYSKEEIEDFKKLSRTGQEAALRLYKSNRRLFEEGKREKTEANQRKAELKWAEDFADGVKSFYRVRGDKEPSPADIVKALNLVKDIDTRGKAALVEYLEAKGEKIPQELLESTDPKSAPSKEITSLLEKVNTLEGKITQQEQTAKTMQIVQGYQTFERTKNAAGSPRYVDILGNSESALKMTGELLSLVSGESELSRHFLQSVVSRNPEATYLDACDAAYRYLGGQVDDTAAPKTDPQEHLKKSNRAAASVPGRGTNGRSGSTAKQLPLDEALAHALQVVNSR